MRDARGVFACERELEKIWRQIDALTARMESTGEVLGYTLPLEVLAERMWIIKQARDLKKFSKAENARGKTTPISETCSPDYTPLPARIESIVMFDHREWKNWDEEDKYGAISKLNELLAPHGVKVCNLSNPATDDFLNLMAVSNIPL